MRDMGREAVVMGRHEAVARRRAPDVMAPTSIQRNRQSKADISQQ